MLPIPSLTAVIIYSTGIPEISPIAIAPISIEIIACILNLIIKISMITNPIIAADTSNIGFKFKFSFIIIPRFLNFIIYVHDIHLIFFWNDFSPRF